MRFLAVTVVTMFLALLIGVDALWKADGMCGYERKWGSGCSMDCNCKENGQCEDWTGSCAKAGGCANGFTGVGGLCNQRTCGRASKWGSGCRRDCNCKENGKCDAWTGSCAEVGGCKIGFIGRKGSCNQPCHNGFGQGCRGSCNCKVSNKCDKVTGSCVKGGGCHRDWFNHENKDNCQRPCHCKNNDKCDKVTGSCANAGGCHRLWINAEGKDNCQKQCPGFTFGKTCKKCHCGITSDHCDRGNGRCDLTWCHAGWMPDPNMTPKQNCQKRCPNGQYGYSCRRLCHCKDDTQCNKETGSCADAGGCAAGWKKRSRDLCNVDICKVDMYDNCRRTCHCVHNIKCNRVSGSCQNAKGCAIGYKSARGRSDCQLPCPVGTWGKDCIYPCNCAAGAQCNLYNGLCKNGCAENFEAYTTQLYLKPITYCKLPSEVDPLLEARRKAFGLI